jgi:hypothetical protein
MTDSLDQQKKTAPRKTGPFRNLVIWLLLVPSVFGTLIFFSDLALVIHLEDLAADTRSFLQAQYQPWPYDEIPPINVEAFFGDIQKEEELFGTPEVSPTVAEEVFGEPPTPEQNVPVESTETQEIEAPTPTPTDFSIVNPPITSTPSRTPTLVPIPQVTWTSTPTRVAPMVTPTFTQPPGYTRTPVPPTLTQTRTIPQTRTFTPTIRPTSTITLTREPQVFAPVHPIAENNGKSVVDPKGQGCLGYFGYRNDSTFEMDIPIGERNFLSEPPSRIAPGSEQPTHFYTDRVSPAFEVVWNSSAPFLWHLDGREAVLQWCNP